jgi:hypothetical protein
MLPKIKYPTYAIKIPSTGKNETFRPFLVKEEKILLMSKSTNDPSDIFRSIKQVVNNCAIDERFDVDKLTIFDLEYIFLKLRSYSVNNIINVSYRDNEDQKIYDFEIDLNSIEVKFPENIEKKIKISDSMGVLMKYPSARLFDDKEYLQSGEDSFFELVLRCVDKIYDGDSIFDVSSYEKKAVEEFLDSLDVNTYQKIINFIENTPKLSYTLNYVNEQGNNRTIELNTLTDFFTLR